MIGFCYKIVATQWFPELLSSSSSRILPSSEFLVVTITKLDQLDWLWWCQWHWQMFWGFEIHVCLYQICVWKWCHLEAKFPIKASQKICKKDIFGKRDIFRFIFWMNSWMVGSYLIRNFLIRKNWGVQNDVKHVMPALMVSIPWISCASDNVSLLFSLGW